MIAGLAALEDAPRAAEVDRYHLASQLKQPTTRVLWIDPQA
jgi:hypothetical protein